jgi:hypothetical protein
MFKKYPEWQPLYKKRTLVVQGRSEVMVEYYTRLFQSSKS